MSDVVIRVRELWAHRRTVWLDGFIRGEISRQVREQVRAQVDTRTADLTRQVVALRRGLTDIGRHLQAVEENQILMEARVTSVEQNEQARWDEAARIAGLVVAEVASIKSQLAEAIADKDAAVAAGVASALGEEAQRDIDRLDALTARLSEVLPVEVVQVPVPDPGEPAVDPDSGQTSDEVLDSGSGEGSGDSE